MNNDFKEDIKNIKKEIDKITLPIKEAREQIDIITEPLKKVKEQIEIAVEPLKIIRKELSKLTLNKELIEGLKFNSMVLKEYFEKMQEPLKIFGKELSQICSKSGISGVEAEKLKEFYWVIPYDATKEELIELLHMENIEDFNEYILNYFDKSKIRKLITDISNNFEKEDKKELMKQIQVAMNNELYSMCITTLVTVLDGLTLELLNPISTCQHKSYEAIEVMLEYINEAPLSEFGYEVYLKVYILNNFYSILYKDERNLKDNNKEILSRHLNSHGVKYLNTRLDSLRLLNAIYFCQEILKETKMQDKFFREKNERGFKIKK